MRRSGRAAFAVAIVAALLFVGVVGNYATRVAGAANVEVDPTSTLAVTATDTFSFTPDEVSDLPLSTTITVDFTNGDASDTVHTFTILGCEGRSIPVGTDDVTPWINGSKCGAPLFNLQGGTGLHKGTLNVSTSGWYMFLCTQPGHFAKNMYGYISFGVALPANLTIAASNLGPGLAVFIIVGTIVTLTVIAIVLGFVVGRRDGARHEMPPERLGYAEPGTAPARPPPPSPPRA